MALTRGQLLEWKAEDAVEALGEMDRALAGLPMRSPEGVLSNFGMLRMEIRRCRRVVSAALDVMRAAGEAA